MRKSIKITLPSLSLIQTEIAKLITLEQGKTLPDAEGDVTRGLQVVEQCCSLTNLLMGETLPGITKDMDLVRM